MNELRHVTLNRAERSLLLWACEVAIATQANDGEGLRILLDEGANVATLDSLTDRIFLAGRRLQIA
ncbi:MAG: hypothetical protein HY331_03175 [Chloroflexi bacterium]|nr:hypothetical protein [Chloroflexota bacterium]